MRNAVYCTVYALLALAAGALCHRFAPGLGLVAMPMFWPLAALSAQVPMQWSVPTAAIVPFVSFALTGMPGYPVVVALKFAALAFIVALVCRSISKTIKKGVK